MTRNVLGLDAAGKVHVGYWYAVSRGSEGLVGNYVGYGEPWF